MSVFKKFLIVLLSILSIEIILISNTYIKFQRSKKLIDTYKNAKKTVIMVDATINRLALYKDDVLVKTYNCATGKPSTPSPIGTWSIIHKDSWGGGFGSRWMGLNVPWGKFGIHGTNLPNSIGYHASGGCIRLKNRDVIELYSLSPHGTKVVIYGGPYGYFGEYLKPLKPGMRCSDVYGVQVLLKAKGYYNANPDGVYGEGLKYSVYKFQKDNGLPINETINMEFYKKLGVIPFE